MTKDERLQKVFQLHNTGRVIGAVTVPVTLWLLLSALSPGGGVLWWTIFIVLSLVGYVLFSAAAMVIAVFYVAAKTPEIESEQPPVLREGVLGQIDLPDKKAEFVSMTIIQTSDSFGTFGETPMYEWIDVKLSDRADAVIRCTFKTTISEDEHLQNLPVNCVVVPPGIVYALPEDSV